MILNKKFNYEHERHIKHLQPGFRIFHYLRSRYLKSNYSIFLPSTTFWFDFFFWNFLIDTNRCVLPLMLLA